MHIAILVKEFPPGIIGGTETQTLRMARELERRSNHQVTVYTKDYGTPETHADEPFDLVRVPNWRRSPFVSTLTFVLAATLYLLRDARDLDVLQCMMIYPNGFVGRVVHLLTGLPYFAWIRGGDFYLMKDNRVKRWLMQRVCEDALVLVQTGRVADDVREEFPHADLRILGNGVSLPDTVADGECVTFVGRLKEQKGVGILVRAMAGVDEQLLIVGDGPRMDDLRELAAASGVDAEFVGEVPPEDVSAYLKRSKLLVLPAIAGEGLPNAVLEGMAHGLPVVATAMAGIPDVVADGERGFVVDPGDEEQLRDRIATLCADDSLRQTYGDNAREYVRETHSWETLVNELTDVYADVRDGTRG